MNNALINFLLLLHFKPSVFNLSVSPSLLLLNVFVHFKFPLLLVDPLPLQLLYHSSDGPDQVELVAFQARVLLQQCVL